MPISKKDRNRAEIVGEVAGEVRLREFSSGATLLSFAVRIRPDDGAAENVPIAWWSPTATDLAAGTRVRVVGRVRRRFYGGAGGLRSAVEVVAEAVQT